MFQNPLQLLVQLWAYTAETASGVLADILDAN